MKIGVLGGGQLGRMLALAGYPLGITFRMYDPSPAASAGRVAELVTGEWTDLAAIGRFAEGVDAITYEFENVPAATVQWLAARFPVHPSPDALAAAQDRLVERHTLERLGIPVVPHVAIDSADALKDAVSRLGLPLVVKTRRLGYDGKGQVVLRDAEGIDAAWRTLGGVPAIAETFVRFDRELSVIAARGSSGQIVYYPLVENHHRDGILDMSLAPAPRLHGALQRDAEACARRVLEAVNYVGVLAIELFQIGERLVANEMAPRVHNSGHWTIEGAECSQFENHVRAIAGLPLGRGIVVARSAMVNLIGGAPDAAELLAVPGAHLHLYGKAPRPRRKLGHVTVCSEDERTLAASLESIRSLVERSRA